MFTVVVILFANVKVFFFFFFYFPLLRRFIENFRIYFTKELYNGLSLGFSIWGEEILSCSASDVNSGF